MRFIIVVLPAQLPPRRARVSFEEMAKEMFSAAKTRPKNLETWETTRISSALACIVVFVSDACFSFGEIVGIFPLAMV